MRTSNYIALLFVISSISTAVQAIETIEHLSNQYLSKQALLHVPTKPVRALLVLIPSGDIHSFSESTGYTPSTVPRTLATQHQIATLIVAPALTTLYGNNLILEELDRVIRTTLNDYSITNKRIAIGGFSAGGLGAARFALHSLRSPERLTKVAALFAVDSPLDYERWAIASRLYLSRLEIAGLDLEEERHAIQVMEKEFGGPPATHLEHYRRASPVSVNLANGGNAPLFKHLPIRLYIEPAVKWRMDHWNRDVDNTNLPDATTLVSLLQLNGNKEVQLVTSVNKGYRRDGSRNPHSWSIVDESNLVVWLVDHLLKQE